MGLQSTGFNPLNRFSYDRIVPTETETQFRRQTLRGDVDDEGAAMFGGVAGHAGIFSDAYDLGILYQMLLNGGEINGNRYLKPETIKLFTAYHNKLSRRGYGFDKPEKIIQQPGQKTPHILSTSFGSNGNIAEKKPGYPSVSASPETFGHTGFTGTCVWVDPRYNLIYVFLSNRVNPTRTNDKIKQLQIREKVLDAIYRALGIQ